MIDGRTMAAGNNVRGWLLGGCAGVVGEDGQLSSAGQGSTRMAAWRLCRRITHSALLDCGRVNVGFTRACDALEKSAFMTKRKWKVAQNFLVGISKSCLQLSLHGV